MPIFSKIWDVFFGCRHRELSRAFTSGAETYKVCLKCGTHIPYSWETMTVLPPHRRDKNSARGSPR